MCTLSGKEDVTITRCLSACTVNPHKLRDVSAYCVSTNRGAILHGAILKINPHNTAVLTCINPPVLLGRPRVCVCVCVCDFSNAICCFVALRSIAYFL